MSKVIVYARADGGVSIISPDPADQRLGESEWAWLDRTGTRAIRRYYPGDRSDPAFAWLQAGTWAADQPRQVIDSTELPSERFRDCWVQGTSAVEVNLSAARDQILREVRRERDLRLRASDGERHRLQEMGTEIERAQLAVYRQQLRDLPTVVQAEISALTTASALEAYSPVFPAPA